MRQLLCLIVMVLVSVMCYSQKAIVSGVIVTEKEDPVKNVNISVLHTKIKAKTNKKGEFQLKDVEPSDTILVYVNKSKYVKFQLGDNDEIKLVLSEKSLDRKDVQEAYAPSPFLPISDLRENKAVSIVTARMIERSHCLSLVDAIKNFFPSVRVQSGEDGRYQAIIRGGKSFNLSNDALVIVDGIETNLDAAESTISVYDIASIEVNKDGLDYGVKGANGVIIIKTKK